MAVEAQAQVYQVNERPLPIEVTGVEALRILREAIQSVKDGKRDYKWVPLLEQTDSYHARISPTKRDPRAHPGYHLFGHDAVRNILCDLMEREFNVDINNPSDRFPGGYWGSERVRTYSSRDAVGNRLVFVADQTVFRPETREAEKPYWHVLSEKVRVRKV